MLMTLTASLPSGANTTAMIPLPLSPMARNRRECELRIAAPSKNERSRSAKSSRWFLRLATRFGSSQTISMHYFVATIQFFVNAVAGPSHRPLL
jgi:hypothetical protein